MEQTDLKAAAIKQKNRILQIHQDCKYQNDQIQFAEKQLKLIQDSIESQLIDKVLPLISVDKIRKGNLNQYLRALKEQDDYQEIVKKRHLRIDKENLPQIFQEKLPNNKRLREVNCGNAYKRLKIYDYLQANSGNLVKLFPSIQKLIFVKTKNSFIQSVISTKFKQIYTDIPDTILNLIQNFYPQRLYKVLMNKGFEIDCKKLNCFTLYKHVLYNFKNRIVEFNGLLYYIMLTLPLDQQYNIHLIIKKLKQEEPLQQIDFQQKQRLKATTKISAILQNQNFTNFNNYDQSVLNKTTLIKLIHLLKKHKKHLKKLSDQLPLTMI